MQHKVELNVENVTWNMVLKLLPRGFTLRSVMGLSWVQCQAFFKDHKSSVVVGQNTYKDDQSGQMCALFLHFCGKKCQEAVFFH